MEHEYSFGAILYKKENGVYKYLIVKDRNDNFSFPKGHKEEGESDLDTAIREVKEEVGIDLFVTNDFCFDIEYLINDTVMKHVSLFMADMKDQVFSYNDPEIKEIMLLEYEKAYELITYKDYKDALKAVNDKLNI